MNKKYRPHGGAMQCKVALPAVLTRIYRAVVVRRPVRACLFGV